MKLDLTGRHVAVTPALESFARTKLAKIEKLVLGPMEAHVILKVEKRRHIAEILVRSRNMSMSAREVTGDMYTSIGTCVDKLETQARKQKEKYEARRRRVKAPKNGDEGAAKKPAKPARSSAAAVRRSTGTRRRRSAAGAGEDLPRIVASDRYPRKPMTVEEAALQVSDSGLGFFVFRNSLSQEINVLFRRKDGTLGLIEPEV